MCSDEPARRNSLRLREYDYSRPGAYFVTICTSNRLLLLGKVKNDQVLLTPTGSVVKMCWMALPSRFQQLTPDEFVVMPNHIHGIVSIRVDVSGSKEPMSPCPLGKMIAYFKYISTREINVLRKTLGERVWQRNYYEHIIRNEEDLQAIRQYIASNPMKWALDRYYQRD